MISRETCPMLPVLEKKSMVIGIIGTEKGAGASFICRLLERELQAGINIDPEKTGEGIRIVDLGERDKERKVAEPDRLIVVVDGSAVSKDRLQRDLKIMKDHGSLWAVVFNKCGDDFEYPVDLLGTEENIPCFRIPFIRVEGFTELYNFIFYS